MSPGTLASGAGATDSSRRPQSSHVLFADDAVTRHLRQVRPPYRTFDLGNSYGHAILMAYGIPQVLGYHGFQLQRYNELGGADTRWKTLLTPNLLDLMAVRFLILRESQAVPGYHQVIGPTPTAFGTTAALYERDTIPAYARVLPAAAKGSDAEVLATVANPQYPISGVALLADTATIRSPAAAPPFPPSRVTAIVTDWRPGAMTITLDGVESTPARLLVSENWYPDWRAEIDGAPGVVRRIDHTLLGVDLPPGAREVRLHFGSAAYARGKVISLLSLLTAALMVILPRWGGQPRPATYHARSHG